MNKHTSRLSPLLPPLLQWLQRNAGHGVEVERRTDRVDPAVVNHVPTEEVAGGMMAGVERAMG